MSEELLLYEGRNKASEVRLTLVLPSQGLLGGFVGYPLPDGLRIIQSQGEKNVESLSSPSIPSLPNGDPAFSCIFVVMRISHLCKAV